MNKDNKKDPDSIKFKIVRFWKTENGKLSLVRDILIALILVLVILTALWAYTGQWFGTPMVAIESGSMQHDDEPFGRFGTINAGDMVLLKKVDSRNDIVTRGSRIQGSLARKDKDHYTYGDYGDVIIYYPKGNKNVDQIIHRAICWVEVNEDGSYTVKEYKIFDETYLGDSSQLSDEGQRLFYEDTGLENYKPMHSGFITKGDNNNIADQKSSQLCIEPIKISWISGKARSEIPWIGTINLFFNDITTGDNTVGNVPKDCIACLVIVIGILISIPISLDFYDYYKTKKKQSIKEVLLQHRNQENNENNISENEKK